ncbi:MAG: hypothetical protein CVV49_06225 [Spirochaetae bacterium HGW-Spirochaetae-5]|nr:MAG: hypothetical protein CVV49_06225 [Spirochaetae bacterium HGW-Spirochaetae-5]
MVYFKNNHKKEVEEHIETERQKLSDEISSSITSVKQQQSEFKNLVEERRNLLSEELLKIDSYSVEDDINKSLFKRVLNQFLKRYYAYRKNRLTNHFDEELYGPFKSIQRSISKLNDFILNSQTDFDKIIEKRTKEFIIEINRTLDFLNEFNPLLIGVIGELSAVKELSRLPVSYHVINDFKMFFNPPVYHKQENDRISSIQADHIVVGPTGIYLIETKNWSRESVKNMDLFSPVKQLKRTGFALFIYLNKLIQYGTLYEFNSGWGDQKLSLKNVLLMINTSTSEQFQFVKIVTISEVNRYITKQPVVMNEKQVSNLVEVLLSDSF